MSGVVAVVVEDVLAALAMLAMIGRLEAVRAIFRPLRAVHCGTSRLFGRGCCHGLGGGKDASFWS